MTHLIHPQVEEVLQQVIFPELLKGRPDFDLPHTKSVVHWMKWLISEMPSSEQKGQNATVLITAAYAHDWGYIGLFEGVDVANLDLVHKMKPLHMERGAEYITKLIQEKLSEFFSEEEVSRVAHLVRVHDRVEDLHTDDELLLMEADTLGMLDVSMVVPTFSKEDNDLFLSREIHGRRLKHFKHQQALNKAEELAEARRMWYESRQSQELDQ